MVYVGTAGWKFPTSNEHESESLSHLQRYSHSLNGVEINSSFYREHRAQTYAKWASKTPSEFRFAVKLSRTFTHEAKLAVDEELLAASLQNILSLGEKLSVLLVQLPPSLAFDSQTVVGFLKILRRQFGGAVALEPRHFTWSSRDAISTLVDFNICKVRADPERCPLPGGLQRATENSLSYLRLHGSPEIYRSDYSAERLQTFAREIRGLSSPLRWCIFDNTFGYSLNNARDLSREIVP